MIEQFSPLVRKRIREIIPVTKRIEIVEANTTKNTQILEPKACKPPDELYGGQVYMGASEKRREARYTVALDTLHISCSACLPKKDVLEQSGTKGIYAVNNIILESQETGTLIYDTRFICYIDGERVAQILAHPRNDKTIRDPNAIKIEFDNLSFYTGDWYNNYKILENQFKIVLNRISRLDICIDGINDLPIVLNAFHKQIPKTQYLGLTGRARLDAKVMNRQTLLYEYFLIGGTKSQKKIVCYNKSLELNKSNKMYIRDFWEGNGLNITQQQYRTELRLEGEEIKAIRGITLDLLPNNKFLLSIFRTSCKNFLQFTEIKKDTNITRQKHYDILDFEQTGAEYLEKIQRPETDGRYSAKQAVKVTLREALFCRHETVEQLQSSIEALKNHLQIYNLWEWYKPKQIDFLVEYEKKALSNPYLSAGRVQAVKEYIMSYNLTEK